MADGGPGAERAWEVSGSVYLDWEKAGYFIIRAGIKYTRHNCLDYIDQSGAVQVCEGQAGSGHVSSDTLEPSLKAIVRF